jgi:hypothetical protein
VPFAAALTWAACLITTTAWRDSRFGRRMGHYGLGAGRGPAVYVASLSSA